MFNPLIHLKYTLLIFTAAALYSCSSNYTLIHIANSKTLIPEGIAVHPVSKEIYLSSLNEDRLVKANKKGENPRTILDRKENGYSLGLGMAFYQDNIYALSMYDRGPTSILSVKNLPSNRLETYHCLERDSSQFNDLAIDKNGNAYITDSQNHEVFFFDNHQKTITSFLKSEQLYYPNGIAMNSDETKLFVSSYSHGLCIVGLDSKKIINEVHKSTKGTGVDGLKYDKGFLYFIMNSRGEGEIIRGLYRVKLNADQTDFEEVETLLINKELLADPTTFSIVNDRIYVIANSQLGNFDDLSGEIKDADILQDVNVIRLKLRRR